jgi:hypothetical protein
VLGARADARGRRPPRRPDLAGEHARHSEPRNYKLDAFNPARLGEVYRGGASPSTAILLGGLLLVKMWSLAGPVAAASVPVLFGSLWLLLGAGPVRGVYSYAPDESQVRQLRQALARRPVDG